MADIARIEERLDRVAMGNTPVSDQMGGIVFQNMTEVMEFAKLMSLSGNAVPKHLQGNPGMCLAVCVQAMEWRFSPFAVANKSYEVQSRLSFESQLVHAVIEQRAPIVGRMRHRFEGEGENRVCIVWATLRENNEILEYRSPPFSKIQPKNSPLWKTKPDLQQYYNTSRDFCRAYFPDVLLGVYSKEELNDHLGPDNAKDVTKPDVASRLRGNKHGRGFSAQHVERESRGGVIDGSTEYPEGASGTAREAPSAGSGTPEASDVGTQSAPPYNASSSQAASPATSETDTPASVSPADAGNHSETEVQRETAGKPLPLAQSGDEPRAFEQESVTTGSGGAHDRVSESASPTLPDGWGIAYAGALRRAQKKESLSKYATQFWAQYGSWADHKNGPNAQTAIAIYDAFDKNFGNKDAIEALLRELV